MADKEQQSHPIAPANGHPRSTDTEASTDAATGHAAAEELRNKNRRILLFVVLFMIFQIGISTLFSLTVMKVRTPKFRVRGATLAALDAGTPANPALSARLNVVFSVKNTNFGRYKYRNATVVFMYRGSPVGRADVQGSRANWGSTRKFSVEVDLNLGNEQMDSQLSKDLNAGIVPITCQAKMRGRVELLFVMRKKKSSDMNCSMEIVRETKQIRNIFCT